MKLEIDYPVSVNQLYCFGKKQVFMSKRARAYKQAAIYQIISQTSVRQLDEFLAIDIQITPPNKRRRDLDNILKITFDCIESAGIIKDDSLIRKASLQFCEPCKPGKINLELTAL